EGRANEGPDDTDSRLFVAHGNVTPRQDVHELAVAPDVAPIMLGGTPGLNDNSHRRAHAGWRRMDLDCGSITRDAILACSLTQSETRVWNCATPKVSINLL